MMTQNIAAIFNYHFPKKKFKVHISQVQVSMTTLEYFSVPFNTVLEVRFAIKSIWNTAVGIKNCKQLFSIRVAFTTQKKATHAAEMMSVECIAIFWVVNASSGEKSCFQFSIPTGSGAGGEGGVSHSLKKKSIGMYVYCIDSPKGCKFFFWKVLSCYTHYTL